MLKVTFGISTANVSRHAIAQAWQLATQESPKQPPIFAIVFTSPLLNDYNDVTRHLQKELTDTPYIGLNTHRINCLNGNQLTLALVLFYDSQPLIKNISVPLDIDDYQEVIDWINKSKNETNSKEISLLGFTDCTDISFYKTWKLLEQKFEINKLVKQISIFGSNTLPSWQYTTKQLLSKSLVLAAFPYNLSFSESDNRFWQEMSLPAQFVLSDRGQIETIDNQSPIEFYRQQFGTENITKHPEIFSKYPLKIVKDSITHIISPVLSENGENLITNYSLPSDFSNQASIYIANQRFDEYQKSLESLKENFTLNCKNPNLIFSFISKAWNQLSPMGINQRLEMFQTLAPENIPIIEIETDMSLLWRDNSLSLKNANITLLGLHQI